MKKRLGSVEKDVGGVLRNLGGLQDNLEDMGKSLETPSNDNDATKPDPPKDGGSKIGRRSPP